MCLAVPGRVLEILDPRSQLARVEVAGIPRTVNTGMLDPEDPARVGDYVLIYTGFATSKIDEADAAQIQGMLDGQEEAYEDFAALTSRIHDEMGAGPRDPGSEGR